MEKYIEDNFDHQSKVWLNEQLASIKNSELSIDFYKKRIKLDIQYIEILKKRIKIDSKCIIDFVQNENLDIEDSLIEKLKNKLGE